MVDSRANGATTSATAEGSPPRTITGMHMLYSTAAQNPATPPALLRRLYTHALVQGDVKNTHYRDRNQGVSLMCSLASNPNLPPEIERAVSATKAATVRKGLLSRPGLSVDDAIELIASEKRLAVLRHAVSVVDDPQGRLATYSMAATPGRWLRADVMASASTTEAARIQAATEVATSNETRELDAATCKRALNVLRRHPKLVVDLAADPRTHRSMREKLDTLATAFVARQKAPVPGKVTKAGLTAWLASAGRTVSEVVDYVGAETRPALLRVAVATYYDSTGVVAETAMRSSQHRTVASAVLTSPDVPTELRKVAAVRVVATGAGLSYEYSEPVRRLVADDVEFASQIALVAGDYGVLRAAMRHLDLSADAVAAIFAQMNKPDDRVLSGNTDWIWLATHPQATAEMRRHALGRVEAMYSCTIGELRAGRTNVEGAWVIELAHAGVVAQEEGPAVAAATVSCAALRQLSNWKDVPGLTAWLAEALDAELAAVDDDTAAQVLTTLAGDFPGTIAELAQTAIAVAGAAG